MTLGSHARSRRWAPCSEARRPIRAPVAYWRDDEREGALRYEEPTVVTCYADPAALTDTARSRLRAFLHTLPRETNQGEVGIAIGDKYYGITEFDNE